jgi:hypothetical protein
MSDDEYGHDLPQQDPATVPGSEDEKDAALASIYAVCDSEHEEGSWFGPDRATYEEASADADAHNEQHPGHNATVLS